MATFFQTAARNGEAWTATFTRIYLPNRNDIDIAPIQFTCSPRFYAGRMFEGRYSGMHPFRAHWGQEEELEIAARLYAQNFVALQPSTNDATPTLLRRYPHPADLNPANDQIGVLDPTVPTGVVEFAGGQHNAGHFRPVFGITRTPRADWRPRRINDSSTHPIVHADLDGLAPGNDSL